MGPRLRARLLRARPLVDQAPAPHRLGAGWPRAGVPDPRLSVREARAGARHRACGPGRPRTEGPTAGDRVGPAAHPRGRCRRGPAGRDDVAARRLENLLAATSRLASAPERSSERAKRPGDPPGRRVDELRTQPALLGELLERLVG